MEKDLEQISQLISDYVHLSRDEIEGYLEGTLDTESLQTVEEHLSSCVYCSNEVELIAESQAEEKAQEATASTRPGPERKGLIGRIFGRWLSSDARPSVSERPVPVRGERKGEYSRLWIGDKSFNLESMYGGLFEVQGLSALELTTAWDEDSKEPGTRPIAIQGTAKRPAMALLSTLAPERDFRKPAPEEPRREVEPPARFYVPSLPDLKEREPRRKASRGLDFLETTQSFSSLKGPEREVMLRGETGHHKIELIREKESGRILVKIIDK